MSPSLADLSGLGPVCESVWQPSRVGGLVMRTTVLGLPRPQLSPATGNFQLAIATQLALETVLFPGSVHPGQTPSTLF